MARSLKPKKTIRSKYENQLKFINCLTFSFFIIVFGIIINPINLNNFLGAL